ncbi:MAG: site-specific DNA-methyltransferase [Acidimicrobiia bacterium]|nr:site-specific DNA-methyltransferase [Acidimicrobiia bacterium]MBV8986739.1 site-specific DNA-methyltransferase [Acidimicrobiia bacterium]MBV9041079.1 site-specific DNA-methyltransferase [Acidimicrobiia bacterium]MBV9285599.1 site-specific DNA-methyltransferase [Acidimicrobiia bacterium]
MAERQRTSTSNFGVGRREAHDASAFYARFEAPEISDDADVLAPEELSESFFKGDARHMADIADGSVALVVTSPPYFVGKSYEEELDREGVPESYLQYLELLRDVFAECKRKLEPGGRIAVNVANLGRKPYRSLSADVIRILQDDLKMLLRGEVIWQKGEGASGSCAWGSFRSAANPVLRDVTERVIIASKGRFDRARSVKERQRLGLPFQNTLSSDEFMAATLDVWEMPPESAKRVNHPAPFPVELPERLIRLYTYANDLVLDPFMGSGSTLVAAARTSRRFAGYDLDRDYVETARKRVADAVPALALGSPPLDSSPRRTAIDPPSVETDDFQARATKEGKAAQAIAERVLEEAGFIIHSRNARQRGLGLTVNLVAADNDGVLWYFDVSGAFTTTRGGLLRTDTVWKCLGRAHVLANQGIKPVVFLTSHLPRRGSEGDVALRAAGPKAFFDAIEMLSDAGRARLEEYARGGHRQPVVGFWTSEELAPEA